MKKISIIALLFFILFSSCSVRDLRTTHAKENRSESEIIKGKRLLEETYLAMGYDNLKDVKTYTAKSRFNWKMPWTLMPMNALPGNKGKELEFKFATRTFDGQVDYLEGRKAGNTYGLQSWQSYDMKKGKTLKESKDKRRKWGIATYHYLAEAPMRIRDAEIIRYAGEKEFEGQQYDLVFATWGKDEPHKEHDQYLVYINKETKMTDMMEITINDFFLPVPNTMKDGTIRTERKLTDKGIYLPSNIIIQLGKPKKKKKHVYRFSFYDYKFDTFSDEVLYPLKDKVRVGEAKEVGR